MYRHIAILGGSFNPIHKGHLMLACAAYESFKADRVLIMPNSITYYKRYDETISDTDRAEMVNLAIEPYPFMEFSDMELKRGGVTYTVDTLRELKEKLPGTRLSFIIGGDSLKYFKTWKNPQELTMLADFLCAVRDDVDADAAAKIISEYEKTYGRKSFYLLNTPMTDISSKEIRKRVAKGIDVSEMLPEAVNEYIIKQNLYRL